MENDDLAAAMSYIVSLSPDQLRVVMAHCAALHTQALGAETTIAALNNVGRALRPGYRRTPSDIIRAVAERHNMSVRDVTSYSRRREYVQARWEAMHELRTKTSLSLPQIARWLGLADHTTVIHGLRRYRASQKA